MKVAAPSLAPILRSDTQGRLLALLLAEPLREYNLTELVQLVGSSMPTVSREVGRADRAGLVRTRKTGPTRLVRANENHPLYPAIRQLILATYGPPAVITETFAQLDGAEAVILFGSWAARYLGVPGHAPNDIDVLVVGDVDLDAMHDAADEAEQRIVMAVQATARPRQAWLDASESFLREVRSRPLLAVLVDDGVTDLVADLNRLTTEERAT